MSNFLDRLAQRTLGTAVLASPRTPGLSFAPSAEPEPHPLTTPHTAQRVPPALALPQTDGAALRATVRPAHRGDRESVPRAVSTAHPARSSASAGAPLVFTPAPAVVRERFETTPAVTASARSGGDFAMPGLVNTAPLAPQAFEPLVPPAPGAPPPAAPVPGPRDTPAPVTGQTTPHPRQIAPGEPTVHITSGAIEVRTPASAPRIERTAAPKPPPGLSLNDYLRRGRGSA